MATLNYRDNVYDRGDFMLGRLGTFWHTIFQDQGVLQQLFRGQFLDAGQTYLNYLEAVATISRFDCPVFHREDWYYLTFLESEMDSAVIRYGDGITYGSGYQYGVKAARSAFAVPLPAGLQNAQFMFNRILQPSLTYTGGVDFEIDTQRGLLTFRADPFESELVSKRNIVNSAGDIVDRQVGLWVYNGTFDLQYLWYHWGYALQVYMASSDYYKDFLNALADCYVQGPSLAAVQGLISALTGVPIVQETQETVEKILQTTDVLQVVTDKHVYELLPNANLVVAEGDVLSGGAPLTDAFLLLELNERMPTAAELPGFAFGPEFIAGEYFSTLLFENKNVDLQYLGVDENDKAVVRFEISGFPPDVEKFWTDVHRKGLESGKVLADYLDTRTVRDVPPTPANLPAQVNPLRLVLDNLMDNNLMLVVLRPTQFPAKAPGVSFFSYLRRAMQPQITYVVYVEVGVGTEYIGFADPALLSEGQTFLDLPEPVVEIIPSTFVSERVRVQLIKEC